MKLPESFIPDKNLEDKVEDLLNKEEFEEQGLAIAIEDSTSADRGRIYVWGGLRWTSLNLSEKERTWS